MQTIPQSCLRGVLVVLVCSAGWSAPPTDSSDAVLTALTQELDRSMRNLAKRPSPPYFISYQVTEIRSTDLSSSFGALTQRSGTRQRVLDIDVRVGSPKLDNSRRLQTMGDNFYRASAAVPLDGDTASLRSVVWFHTDRIYKEAAEELMRCMTEKEVRVTSDDTSNDFSAGTAERFLEPLPEFRVDTAAWIARVKRYSGRFLAGERLFSGQADFSGSLRTVWYVNTEGTRLRMVQPRYTVNLSASTRADDGMQLPLYQSYLARTEQRLPPDSAIVAMADSIVARLAALRSAPVIEPYSGPAILSGRAAAVFFHEVLGHRLEAQRMKNDRDGQTLKKKVGEKILPEVLSVNADPTMRTFGAADLNGSYLFDDEGTKSRPVSLIERGTLVGFLTSRAPIQGFPLSNGHGRKAPGMIPVARQSNILIQSSNAVSGDQLRALLIDKCKATGKPFGLYFSDITGGFTNTSRIMPNAFNVTPVLVFRVYLDGRTELVRGVDLIGTPLSTIATIVATDDAPDVFNGTCGAESGGVPVSAVSPAILVGTIEVQKKAKAQDKLPILPAPPRSARKSNGGAT